jgi:hypothetical protein
MLAVDTLFTACFPGHMVLATEDDNVVFFGMVGAPSKTEGGQQFAAPTAADMTTAMNVVASDDREPDEDGSILAGKTRRPNMLSLLPDVMRILQETPCHFENRVGWMTSEEFQFVLTHSIGDYDHLSQDNGEDDRHEEAEEETEPSK